MKLLIGFFKFWYDFIIGESWQIAAGIALLLAAGVGLVHFGMFSGPWLAVSLAAAVMLLAGMLVAYEARLSLQPRPQRKSLEDIS
ncbi:MAG: hypothetical protein ACE5H7_17840 [Acidiferrobacterales bacterium]